MKTRQRLSLVVLVATLASAAVAAPAAAADATTELDLADGATVDQQQTLADAGFGVVDFSGGTLGATQTFTAGKSGELVGVSLYVGCCADWTGVIRGTPPGSGLFVSVGDVTASGSAYSSAHGWAVVPPGEFVADGSLRWMYVPLGCFYDACNHPVVVAGHQYTIALQVYQGIDDPVCTADGDMSFLDVGDCGYQWGRTAPSAYAGGSGFGLWGGVWHTEDRADPSLADYDFAFKTYVLSAPQTDIQSGPSAATNDRTPTFAFSGSDSTTASASLRYSYKVDDGAWSGYSSATSVRLGGSTGLPDGPHTFAVKAKNDAGVEDPTPAQQSFVVDTVAPAGTVTINGGASVTQSQLVTLTLVASDPAPRSGVRTMRISNTTSGLASAVWEPYAATRSWLLSAGHALKTVYVQYADAAGNASGVAQTTIRYRG
jgi:hypothetical protein